jgi:hypothetical protein
VLKKSFNHKYFFIIAALLGYNFLGAQGILTRGFPTGSSSAGNDSLKRRDRFEDSITIRFHYLDSSRNLLIDSSINDFTTRFPVPITYHYLGNPGTAAKSILFAPQQKIGWDPGFHAYDIYKWMLERVRFFNTTRPYTELGYMLGSQSQQIIEVLQTQNLKPYWNATLQFRAINNPGFFQNQKTAHNNYLLSSWYQSPNRRYNNYFVLLGNKLRAGENGGIKNDTDYLNIAQYNERLSVPTKIGVAQPFSRNFFGNDIRTGNRYNESDFLLRQQYDVGQKDSIVTDSTVIPLFYPRLRFEHTIKYGSYKYEFSDVDADSIYYSHNYRINLPSLTDTLLLSDKWKEWTNDFSIYQFPDAKNSQQFIKAGMEYQWLKGILKNRSENYYNLIVHGEYRNRTRNQKWDMAASGRLYINGLNAGDYRAYISLERLISNKIGSLQVGFENYNRSPSFLYRQESNFYLGEPTTFSTENTTHLFANIFNPFLKLQLSADYFLVGNYLYFTDLYKPRQENALFNVLRIQASKKWRLGKNWSWYGDVYLQQKAGNADLNLPLVLTRNRIMYEGNFGFKNLDIAFGAEMRYHTPYKADNYSPILGKFIYQDTLQIKNRPDVNAFLHFRIRSFKAYARAENLNTFRINNGGVEFKEQNFAAPDYPYPGLVIRLGIYWSFVN